MSGNFLLGFFTLCVAYYIGDLNKVSFRSSCCGEGVEKYYLHVKQFESVHKSAIEVLTSIISCE